MTIEVPCSQCNKSYRVTDDFAGKRVKCPKGHVLVIPLARGSHCPPPTEPASASTPAAETNSLRHVAGSVTSRTLIILGGSAAAVLFLAVAATSCFLLLRIGRPGLEPRGENVPAAAEKQERLKASKAEQAAGKKAMEGESKKVDEFPPDKTRPSERSQRRDVIPEKESNKEDEVTVVEEKSKSPVAKVLVTARKFGVMKEGKPFGIWVQQGRKKQYDPIRGYETLEEWNTQEYFTVEHVNGIPHGLTIFWENKNPKTFMSIVEGQVSGPVFSPVESLSVGDYQLWSRNVMQGKPWINYKLPPEMEEGYRRAIEDHENARRILLKKAPSLSSWFE